MTTAGRRRAACHLHLLSRAADRGIVFTADDVVRLEGAIEKARPAFEQPGIDRYKLRVKLAGTRMRVVYDADLKCLVTVWRPNGRR